MTFEPLDIYQYGRRAAIAILVSAVLIQLIEEFVRILDELLTHGLLRLHLLCNQRYQKLVHVQNTVKFHLDILKILLYDSNELLDNGLDCVLGRFLLRPYDVDEVH